MFSPRHFVLGSKSAHKVDALTEGVETLFAGFEPAPGLEFVKAKSSVNEQPYCFKEILTGSVNRALSAYALHLFGDSKAQEDSSTLVVMVAMENGIEPQNEFAPVYADTGLEYPACDYDDYAVVLAYVPKLDLMVWEKSEKCVFPWEAVKETILKPGGFKENTVGQTLFEQGIVKDATDPHIDLMGVRRKDLLLDPTIKAIQRVMANIYL
jgi:hypothetical protein